MSSIRVGPNEDPHPRFTSEQPHVEGLWEGGKREDFSHADRGVFVLVPSGLEFRDPFPTEPCLEFKLKPECLGFLVRLSGLLSPDVDAASQFSTHHPCHCVLELIATLLPHPHRETIRDAIGLAGMAAL